MQEQLIRATGRHHARHAGRFCFWSYATRVRLRSPIGPKSLHTQPCGLRLEALRTVWIAQNGDLPGADFPSVKREQRDVIQAQLLCCRRTGGAGGYSSCGFCVKYDVRPPPFPSHSHSHSLPHPIPLHSGAMAGQLYQSLWLHPWSA